MTKASALTHDLLGGEEVLADLVAEITEKCQAGKSVDIESYVRRYPGHEQRLRRLLPAMQALVDLGVSACRRP